ncbi:MAG TPA: ankyrin repeat domain-containing protein [Dongiaceae bacterium]|nr:ankyrin repeat domain-containing protein [Dongiaceae bacterium]
MNAPTEFVQALVDKNFTSAEKLLARTDINHEVNEAGWTPLHYAIEMGISESAEWLLQHGADPNWKDRSGWTPLHLAVDGAADVASQRYVEHGVAGVELGLIRLLLRHGADPSAVSNDGQTPVSIADDYGRSEVAELLRAGWPAQETNG